MKPKARSTRLESWSVQRPRSNKREPFLLLKTPAGTPTSQAWFFRRSHCRMVIRLGSVFAPEHLPIGQALFTHPSPLSPWGSFCPPPPHKCRNPISSSGQPPLPQIWALGGGGSFLESSSGASESYFQWCFRAVCRGYFELSSGVSWSYFHDDLGLSARGPFFSCLQGRLGAAFSDALGVFLQGFWGNPDISTAPLPMWYTSMGYTPMRYTSTALYFYTERTQVPSQFFK